MKVLKITAYELNYKCKLKYVIHNFIALHNFIKHNG